MKFWRYMPFVYKVIRYFSFSHSVAAVFDVDNPGKEDMIPTSITTPLRV